MKEKRNKLMFVNCLIVIKDFAKNLNNQISEKDANIRITEITGENSLNNVAKNYLYMLIFIIIFIIVPKFPKCFLEILVIFMNLLLLISPKHLGNFGQ